MLQSKQHERPRFCCTQQIERKMNVSKYPDVFRQQVLEMAQNERVQKVSEFFNIPEITVRRWKREYNKIGESETPSDDGSQHERDVIPEISNDGAISTMDNCQAADDADLSESEQAVEANDPAQNLSAEELQDEGKCHVGDRDNPTKEAKSRASSRRTKTDSNYEMQSLITENEKLRAENRRLKAAIMTLVQ